MQAHALVVTVYGHTLRADGSTAMIDTPRAAPLSVIKALYPSDDAETACVVDLSTLELHASTCILLKEAVCATRCVGR